MLEALVRSGGEKAASQAVETFSQVSEMIANTR